MKLLIVHFCSVLLEKLEFLLPLLPTKRYYEWWYNAVLLRLFKNCSSSTTSCFTKNCDVDVQTIVDLKGAVASFTVWAAIFFV